MPGYNTHTKPMTDTISKPNSSFFLNETTTLDETDPINLSIRKDELNETNPSIDVFPDSKLFDLINKNMKDYISISKNASITEDITNDIFYNMHNHYNNAYKLIKSSKFNGDNNKKYNIMIASMLYNIFKRNNQYKFNTNDLKIILKNTNLDELYITNIINDKFIINAMDEDYIPKYIEFFSTFNKYIINIDEMDSIDITNYLSNYKLTYSKCSKYNDVTINNLTKRQVAKINSIGDQI